MTGSSLAGAACVDITPPVGTMLECYHRTDPSTGVNDRLYVSALVLVRGGEEPFVLLTVDTAVLLVPEANALRDAVGAQVGVRTDRVMVCVGHTHSGPRVTPAYLARLRSEAVSAARQALAGARPVRIGWGVGHAVAATNRRGETSAQKLDQRQVSDQRLGVLSLEQMDGVPLAVLLWYSAHGTVLKGDSNVISADWPGAARQVVSAVLGCPALVAIGASGNVNPRWRGSVRALRRMGLLIGGEALKVLAGLERAPLTDLRVCSQTIPLRLQPLPDEAEAERRAAEAAAAWEVPAEPWLAAVRECRAQGDIARTLPLEIHFVRINDAILGGIPMEPFTEIGMHIAQRGADRTVFFGGHTNGWIGYLPTAEEYTSGGYEVDWAPVVYGTRSGWLTPAVPETASEIAATANDMIARLTT